LVIAIDGPSGVGKSSTSRGVASRLGLAYLDTGSMYRAVAWRSLHDGVIDDPDACIAIATDARIDVITSADGPGISIDGVDVNAAIREPEVSANVSKVATIQPVRDALSAQMRRIIAEQGRIVAEGRDITTKVAPDADVRVLLVADPNERIRRRQAELEGKVNTEQVVDQVVRRDRDDATVSQFETPAPGVELLDSTYLNLDEVVERVIALVPQEKL
jgi:cytidylate kinase